MKNIQTDRDATERARTTLDAIENDFFKVHTGLRAGQPPPGVYQGNGNHSGWEEEPIIVPLYGVIIEE